MAALPKEVGLDTLYGTDIERVNDWNVYAVFIGAGDSESFGHSLVSRTKEFI